MVMGVGPVGLMAIAGARLRGAGRIIAIGSRKAGVELARFYGATDLVNYKEGNVERQIYELTHKQGADCCICAGGGTEALGQAVAWLAGAGPSGNVNYFTTYGDLPLNNVRYGFGMATRRSGAASAPAGGRGWKSSWPCCNTAGWTPCPSSPTVSRAWTRWRRRSISWRKNRRRW